ncbi:MAG TPA: putative peptidoglycan glycosyltransferase FtsW [Clostridia bacterium]|nr:putative peptidoglycan glycosyltransferase FtsW [Clostridia bacterium]
MAGAQNKNTTPNSKQLKNDVKNIAKIKFKEYFPFLKPRKLRYYIAKGEFDLNFLIIVLFLMSIGLVMVFSSSYIMALNDSSLSISNNPYHYITKQVFFSIIGIVVLYVFSRINHDFIKQLSVLALVVSIVLLILVLFYFVKLEGRGGIRRYMPVPIFNQFQPSEVAKLGLIMFCAWGMERNYKQISKNVLLLWPYVAVIIVMSGLIYKENHLSGTVLILSIGMVMLFLSGAKLRWFIIAGIPVLILAAGVIYAFWLAANKPDEAAAFLPDRFVGWGRDPESAPKYMLVRIFAWLKKDYQPLGARWQTNNSLYAIASGGMLGKGLGNSLQKHFYLSEAHNDFIFSIICEELGFVGAMVVIVLFALLMWRGFMIASQAKDRFGTLLVTGIVFQVGLQAVIHIAVVTDTIPNTGISLPFISYGGTSLMILLAEMGMVLSVSRTARMEK